MTSKIDSISQYISSEQIVEIREQMIKFTHLQLADPILAEDIVQETLLSVVKNIEQFKQESALKTWIFAILKNKIIDYLRKKNRFIVETDLTSEEDNNSFFDQAGHWKAECYPTDWQENAVYSEQFWLIFETCLTHLPAKQAKVFMMRECLELPTNEICDTVEITSNNLHILLHRARLQLQNCLSIKLMLESRK